MLRLTLRVRGDRLFVRAAHNLKDWEMNSSTRREVAGQCPHLDLCHANNLYRYSIQARSREHSRRAPGLTVAGVTRALVLSCVGDKGSGCEARTVPATVYRRLCRTPIK